MRSMVCSGEREMAMGTQRSTPLHNFDLPCLKWGNRRHLRCMKLDDASNATNGPSAASSVPVSDQNQHCRRRVVQRRRSPPSKLESLVVGGMRRRELESSLSPSRKNTDCAREKRLMIPKGEAAAGGIEAVREKIMKDLKTAADEIKGAIFRDEVSDDVDDDDVEFEEPTNKQKVTEKEREELPAVEVELRPWNLRTRRSACKAPAPIDGEATNNNFSTPMTNEAFKPPKVRDKRSSLASPPPSADKKRTRSKFSVSLSKEEIEEDFKAMVGHRPPRRPKKRARNVQKQLDFLFPGLWLKEVTMDSYKVPELAENGKR